MTLESLGVLGSSSGGGGSVPAPPTDGLVCHLTMDSADVSSGTVTDQSGNGNSATVNGNPTTGTTGKIGEAIAFDGDGDYLQIAGNTPMSSKTFSVSLWYNINTNAADPESSIYAQNGDESSTNTFMIGYSYGSVWFQVGATNNRYYLADSVTKGSWHHIVVVHSGNGLFITHDDTLAAANKSNDVTPNENYLTVGGGDIEETPENWFHGKADQLRHYDRALSIKEVNALLAEGST